ncbi:hypothetical protein ABH900_003548 [Stenotrophomonas sp. AN71]|uniref:hypothetical protein n=1 Tax=Stenotrophomonas TaxID=40323 RepID=UPI001070DFA2|nr:hypothetical protein [Stenotrophomonas indicatrix]QBR44161.1 hypothetical protein DAIF1_17240 [Stenotrophomonas indicatrix]
MARQVIDTTTQNPGWIGDLAKVAFTKTNENFAELYDASDRVALLTGKNLIINGDFRFWQRATAQTERDTGYAPLYLAADRWYMAAAATKVGMSRQAFTVGQTQVPGSPQYYMRVSSNSGISAAALGYFGQTIEGVGTFAGQTATLSFYAKGNVAAKLGVSFVQSFGTGGSPDNWSIVGPVLNISTTWKLYTVTVDIPSIAGKAVGSGNDHLRVRLWLDAGSNYTDQAGAVGSQTWALDIANVQIEAGGIATGFEQRNPALEMLLCQRYYEINGGIATSDGAYFSTHYYKVQKRVTPSLTVTSGSVSPATLNPRGNSGFFSMDGRASSSNAFTVAIDAEL